MSVNKEELRQLKEIVKAKREIEAEAQKDIEAMREARSGLFGNEKLRLLSLEVDLYLRGNTAEKIARIINEASEIDKAIVEASGGGQMTEGRVLKDISEFIKLWREVYIANPDMVMAQEMSRIDRLEQTYWEAWNRSQTYIEDYEDEELLKPVEGEELLVPDEKRLIEMRERVVQRIKRIKKRRSLGDVEFLKGIERCVKLRFDLLGIGKTSNINVNWRNEAARLGFNPDEIVDAIVKEFSKEDSRALEGILEEESDDF